MRWICTLLMIFSLFSHSRAADLQVRLEGIQDTLFIGDMIELKLFVDAPADGQVFPPDWDEALSPFELIVPSDTLTLTGDADGRRYLFNLGISCYTAGDQVLQPIPVRWVSEDGSRTDSLETEPYIIHVQGVVPDSILALADTVQQAHHLLQPNRARRLSYSFSEIAFWLLLLLIAAAMVLTLRWWLTRRKRQTRVEEEGPPPRPPAEIALEELNTLRDRQLYQAGHIKEYYSHLSNIIRRYIDPPLDAPALESTTFQLLCEMEKYVVNREIYDLLETMLADADLAKFAKHQPNADTCQNDLQNSYIFVNKTKPAPQPILSEEAA